MNLSNPDSPLGLLRRCDKRPQQAAEHGPHVAAPVEAELDLGEVAVAVLGELDRVVRAGQRGFHIADERVDGAEFLVEHARLAATGDLAVVNGAHRGSRRPR